MNGVFVFSNSKKPLMPTSPVRARLLLKKGKAVVFKKYPFSIMLKGRVEGEVQALRLKVDPGSKETGIVLVNEVTLKVLFAMVLVHRGQQIKGNLDSRRAIRRERRNRNTRYRAPRFDNRTRPAGWLPPSLQHRVETVMTWVGRLCKAAPVTALSQELIKFDLQQMENPEIAGIEYQQGTLFGYEVREYLLEKWNRTCAYCGAKDVPLQAEHVVAKANGGTNRVSNLTLACEPCNTKKGTTLIEVFLADKPDLLKKIQDQLKRPLKDAAAVNATRWALYERLKATDLPLEVGSGGRTKFNRKQLGLPKQHWIDAACVGVTGETVVVDQKMLPLKVKAVGHGNRQMCGTDKFGFPIRHRSNQKVHFGFQTGDMVKAVVTTGKKVGVYAGKVMTRASGKFDIATVGGRVTGISHRFCRVAHKKDGYLYAA